MTPDEIAASKYRCQHDGCMRHPSSGDTIIRTSPKGQPFAGLCEAEHYPPPLPSSGTPGDAPEGASP